MPSFVIGSLRVDLGINTAAFAAALDGLAGRVKGIGKKLQLIGAGMSAGITAPLVAFGKASLDAFQHSEDALKQVETALKSTGGVVGFTTKQLAGMAAGLQKVSTFDDDEILQNVTAQLLKFGSVTGDTFVKAQQAIIDFSARTGTDLQAATQVIGKALDNPAKALGMLRKAGVTFSTDQEALIASLVKTGHTAEAQGVILDALTQKFGGAAEAMRETTSGNLAEAWNEWGDAMEAVGQVVAEVIPPIAAGIRTVAEGFLALSPETQRFIVIAAGIAAVVGPAVTVLGLLAVGIGAIGLPIVGVIAGLTALTAIIVKFWPEIRNAELAIAAFAVAIGESAKAKLTGFWQAFVEMKEKALAAVQALVEGVKQWLVDKMNAVVDLALAPIHRMEAGFQWLYEQTIGHSWIPDMVTGVESWMSRLGDSFGNSIGGLINGTMSWKDALSDLIRTLAQLAIGSLGGGKGGFFGSLMSGLANSIGGFATGGNFSVGGTGGIDSQLVAFRASPGEMVDIHKPGNDNIGGGIETLRLILETIPNPLFTTLVREEVDAGGKRTLAAVHSTLSEKQRAYG